MKSLTALGALCSKVDKGYLVSLRYGAHTGDVHGYYVTVDLPQVGYYTASGVFDPENVYEMERICSDIGTHIQQRFPQVFESTYEEITFSLDNYTEKSRSHAVPGRP